MIGEMTDDILERLQAVAGEGNPLVVDAMIEIQRLRDGADAAVERRTREICAYLRDQGGTYGLVVSRVLAKEFLDEDP